MVKNKGKLLNVILPIAIISIYYFLSFVKIGFPGVHYDEILFGNAAIGMIDDTFVRVKIGNIPIFLMPYMGNAVDLTPFIGPFAVSASGFSGE